MPSTSLIRIIFLTIMNTFYLMNIAREGDMAD